MKLVIIIVAIYVFCGSFDGAASKESVMYLGHAEYTKDKHETCIVRPIYARSKKEADSLFLALTDSLVKKDNGVLQSGNYKVWQIKPTMVLKKESNDTDWRN